jgi:hypothetical protein
MTSTKYIGMDVHKESISIAVMNSVGKVVMECVIETKASVRLVPSLVAASVLPAEWSRRRRRLGKWHLLTAGPSNHLCQLAGRSQRHVKLGLGVAAIRTCGNNPPTDNKKTLSSTIVRTHRKTFTNLVRVR